jgi:hypothetical protein
VDGSRRDYGADRATFTPGPSAAMSFSGCGLFHRDGPTERGQPCPRDPKTENYSRAQSIDEHADSVVRAALPYFGA